MTNGAVAQIATGVVRHRRLRPVANAFEYRTYFLMLPMRRLRDQPCAALARNRFGLLAFHDRDHGDGRSDALAWLDELLHAEGITDADGEVWLQTYPRVLGYVFKPVSFWHCERADGSLAAIVAEVNNTFGERHCYLLAGEQLGYGRDLQARKVFHVSPFSHIVGGYRFRFMRSASRDGERYVARIDHEDADGALLQTSLSGRLAPLTPASARAAFFGMPMMSFGVIARIHWQALRVWAKRVPYVKKPPPPEHFVTR
ncbi:MAG: DUF1365 domain-containing protein [Burkholderiaceae bacterium]|nr:DUF1365 domain-containing protein [Burkholderiaceae bacterium]